MQWHLGMNLRLNLLLPGERECHGLSSLVIKEQQNSPRWLIFIMSHCFSNLKVAESSCMLVPQAAPVPAPAAPPAGIRRSHLPHTPSPHLRRRLPSQRLGCWSREQVEALLHPPNWCSSSQRCTATLRQQLLLLSTPMLTPLQERGPVGSRELSQVSDIPRSTRYKVYKYYPSDESSFFYRDRWNGPAVQSLRGHCIWFPLRSSRMWGLQGKKTNKQMIRKTGLMSLYPSESIFICFFSSIGILSPQYSTEH